MRDKNFTGVSDMMMVNGYTCSCCGYKTLSTNDIGEICPICFWEEDYSSNQDAFYRTGANPVCLYRAQMNFLETGSSSSKVKKFCRKPSITDVRDIAWISVQSLVEKENSNLSELIDKIVKLSEHFKDDQQEVIFQNFEQLNDCHLDEEFDDDDVMNLADNLRSLCLALSKFNIMKLKEIFITYYKAGLSYYVYWSLLLEILLKHLSLKSDSEFTDVILSIELNDCYGSLYLRDAIKKFWANPAVNFV